MDFTNVLMAVGFIFCMGIMDHSRGTDNKIPKLIDMAIYGWLAAALLGRSFDALTICITLLFMLGMSFAWGEPLGSALDDKPMRPDHTEWWQVGPLKTNAWLALIARGALWGVCLLPLLHWEPRVVTVIPAYAIAVPGAIVITRFVKGDWMTQEYIRGWLGGTLIWLFGSTLL